MSTMAVSQITLVSIICSTICSGTDQRKHQSFESLAVVNWIDRWPVDSPHKGPVTMTLKMFPFDDAIISLVFITELINKAGVFQIHFPEEMIGIFQFTLICSQGTEWLKSAEASFGSDNDPASLERGTKHFPHLCVGEWIPLTKASYAYIFFVVNMNKLSNKQSFLVANLNKFLNSWTVELPVFVTSLWCSMNQFVLTLKLDIDNHQFNGAVFHESQLPHHIRCIWRIH